MKPVEIIKNLINVIGSSVGVIMIAIGSVMLIGAFMKLYVFDLKVNPHFQAYRCDEFINGGTYMQADDKDKSREELTDAQREQKYSACVVRETEREEKNFLNQKKHNMIDGVALLLVGAPILIYYTRRSRRA